MIQNFVTMQATFGTMDPYCVVAVGTQSIRSKVLTINAAIVSIEHTHCSTPLTTKVCNNGGVTPTWDQTIRLCFNFLELPVLTISSQIVEGIDRLSIECYNQGTISDDFVGAHRTVDLKPVFQRGYLRMQSNLTI
jgi:hypothetical protein